MPSQAETIAALQGLNPATYPQSPADPYAAAMTFGSALGIPDAIKALKGQMTTEEAKNFALGALPGLIPGAKAETAAVKTMGELLPHLYPEASMFAKMTPKEYLSTMGSSLPKKLPQDVEKVLSPYMTEGVAPGTKVPGPGPVKQYSKLTADETAARQVFNGTNYSLVPTAEPGDYHVKIPMGTGPYAEFTKNEDGTYHILMPNTGHTNTADNLPQAANLVKHFQGPNGKAGWTPPIQSKIDQTEIDKALAKDPGASIFDIAQTHVGGPSSNYSYKNSVPGQDVSKLVDFSTIPREATPQVPLAAKALGRTENLAHGTRIPIRQWEGGEDKLKLPDDELGVHFGNPKQSATFAGSFLGGAQEADPRTYPTVVAVNNPLRMRDMGTWHEDQINTALRNLNNGTTRGGYGAKIDSPETVGKFPDEELDKLDGIKDYRDYLSSKGYDSIVYKNKSEDPGHDSFIKFTESPVDPGFVNGVRSPYAAFDPTKLSHASLAAGLAGGGVALPAIDPNLLKALSGDNQQQ